MDVYAYVDLDDGVDVGYKFKAAFFLIGLALLNIYHHWHCSLLNI